MLRLMFFLPSLHLIVVLFVCLAYFNQRCYSTVCLFFPFLFNDDFLIFIKGEMALDFNSKKAARCFIPIFPPCPKEKSKHLLKRLKHKES